MHKQAALAHFTAAILKSSKTWGLKRVGASHFLSFVKHRIYFRNKLLRGFPLNGFLLDPPGSHEGGHPFIPPRYVRPLAYPCRWFSILDARPFAPNFVNAILSHSRRRKKAHEKSDVGEYTSRDICTTYSATASKDDNLTPTQRQTRYV